ncbi:hypothetical protein TNCV_3549572 [Trichonephila clavipes]|nr:hypothetical protein TNCV_3549572 [Trichonephila clavipes]
MIHMKGKSSLVCILNCVLNSEILSKKGRKIHSTASNSFEALMSEEKVVLFQNYIEFCLLKSLKVEKCHVSFPF